MQVVTIYRSEYGYDYDRIEDCVEAERRYKACIHQSQEFHNSDKSLYDCLLDINPHISKYADDDLLYVYKNFNRNTKLIVKHWCGNDRPSVEFSHFSFDKYGHNLLFIDKKGVIGAYTSKIRGVDLVRYYEHTFGKITDEQLKSTQ